MKEKMYETPNSFFDDFTSSSIDMSEIPEISSSLLTISKIFSWFIYHLAHSDPFLGLFGLFLVHKWFLDFKYFLDLKWISFVLFCGADRKWKYSRAWIWSKSIFMKAHEWSWSISLEKDWFFDHKPTSQMTLKWHKTDI